MTGARTVQALLEGIAALDPLTPAARQMALTDITLDSRQVQPGGAFLACRGARHHGLEFAAEVAQRGAAAIFYETAGDGALPGLATPPSSSLANSQIVLAPVPDLSAQASRIAGRFFGEPSRALDVIGITGTNGKTTCAWLLSQALESCGLRSAYLGTLGSAVAGQLVPGELTTPDAVTAQRELARFRAAGAGSAAVEVSSHALAQHRVDGLRFDAAVFTNLTRDHLDFHGDMERYGAAKARLFGFEGIRHRIFNVDDPFGAQLAARPAWAGRIACTRRAGPVEGSGPVLRARDLQLGRGGMRFALESSFGAAAVETPLIGSFNVDNVLAVIAVLLARGIAMSRALDSLARLSPPSGRLECFTAPGEPLVVVDYAHTPDALAKALEVVRAHCSGRLVCVFGCGGDRDAGKRPEMGAVAARFADRIVLTDDNPRSEDPADIVMQIRAGTESRPVEVIHDRAAAILRAIAQCGPGDAVLVAGKGHEAHQQVGRERRPFSDQRVVREALAVAPRVTGGGACA
jgi:UDP-N-acetylmuramoyl-L-alanyl-D-glutamate--2,6-diaminopimelate ligase